MSLVAKGKSFVEKREGSLADLRLEGGLLAWQGPFKERVWPDRKPLTWALPFGPAEQLGRNDGV